MIMDFSGPVVGGLVGLKTPKYCLYGDSMSYITHLEATGPPLRIQVSPDFKEKLNDVGGFETIIRGPVRVKVNKPSLNFHCELRNHSGTAQPLG